MGAAGDPVDDLGGAEPGHGNDSDCAVVTPPVTNTWLPASHEFERYAHRGEAGG